MGLDAAYFALSQQFWMSEVVVTVLASSIASQTCEDQQLMLVLLPYREKLTRKYFNLGPA